MGKVITAFVFIACITLSACEDSINSSKDIVRMSDGDYKAHEFTYKGHDYIKFSRSYSTEYMGFVHNPDCKKCNKKH